MMMISSFNPLPLRYVSYCTWYIIHTKTGKVFVEIANNYCLGLFLFIGNAEKAGASMACFVVFYAIMVVYEGLRKEVFVAKNLTN